MSESKLGWQFQTVPGWARDVVNSAWVKIIDPPFTNPFDADVKTIGRVYLEDGATNRMITRGASGAQEWFNAVAPTVLARPWVHAWELPNEPQPVASWDFCKCLTQFSLEAVDLLHGIQRKAVAGNISEGNPGGDTPEERANLFCEIACGMVNADYWDMHCYWVPDGYPHKEAGFNEWHALRYRLNVRYAAAHAIKLPPLLIGECGIDGGIVGRPRNEAGWRAFGLRWPDYQHDHLARFDDEIAKDDYVLAALPFISGTGNNTDWLSFAYEEVESKELARYITYKQLAPSAPVRTVVEQVNVFAGLARPFREGIGEVTQWYGERPSYYAQYGATAGHDGIDYGVPLNTPVLACHGGTVYNLYEAQGYGKHVKVMGDGMYTIYGHLNDYELADGAVVAAGAIIGLSGNTGASTGPHLHLGWKVIGVPMPGYLDHQNPLLGRVIHEQAQNLPQGRGLDDRLFHLG